MKQSVCQGVRVVLFLAVLCLMLKTANYCLYNDNSYTRITFHEMYCSDPIDIAFIGSSNVYRHFAPEIWDSVTKRYTFNLGTSSQTPDDAYFVMKELFKSQSPQYCIYGINFLLFLKQDGYKNPVKSYIIYDYLKPSLDKYIYGYTVFQNSSLLQGWLPAARNSNQNLLKTAKNVIRTKLTEEYRTYGYDVYKKTSEEYRGKGFVYSYNQTETGGVGAPGGYRFRDYPLSEKYISYLKKLKKLCDINACELVFVVPPLPYASMRAEKDYQEAVDLYNALSEELGVTIFPFDLSRHDVLFMEDDDFYDYAHMSGKGAEKFSRAAAELFRRYMDGEKIDRERYFYSSYEELLDQSPWIFSTWLEETEDGFTAQSAYGNRVVPEYCFRWSDDQGETWHMLREYSGNNRIASEDLPDGCGMLMVWAKPEGKQLEQADYQQCDRVELK